MRQFEQLRETWDADAVEPISDFIDAADRVVVRFIWRGAGHGPESNMELTGVYTVRKGRIFCHGVLLGSRGGPRSRGAVGARRSRRLLSLRDTARAMSQENVEIVRRRDSSPGCGPSRARRVRWHPSSRPTLDVRIRCALRRRDAMAQRDAAGGLAEAAGTRLETSRAGRQFIAPAIRSSVEALSTQPAWERASAIAVSSRRLGQGIG